MTRQEELTKAMEKLSTLQEELTNLKGVEKELRAEFVALKEEVRSRPCASYESQLFSHRG